MPVVFYHGMGDSAHSEGMKELFASVSDIDPNIFIHSIYVCVLGFTWGRYSFLVVLVDRWSIGSVEWTDTVRTNDNWLYFFLDV